MLDAAGYLPAGILLYRIRYWAQYAVLDRGDGRKWIARTTEEWCEETGLSQNQIKKALRTLRFIGAIETEKHFFGPRCMNWLRETDPIGECQTTPTGSGHSDTNQTSEIQDHRDTKDEILGVVENHAPKGDFSVKVTELAEAFGAKKEVDLKEVEAKSENCISVTDFCEVWRDCMIHNTKSFVPSLTNKQKGQLSQINQKLPPFTTGPFLFLVLTQWQDAMAYLKVNGNPKLKGHPNPGLVLSCLPKLIEWASDVSSKEADAKDAPKPASKWGLL